MKKVELEEVAKELQSIATSLNAVIASISVKEETAPKNAPSKLTLEDVRAVLVEKSRAGFREEVKALLTKYGAKTLSEVKAESYAALKLEAEALQNGK